MLNMEEITQQLENTYLENGEITEISLVPAGDLPSIPGFPIKDVPEHMEKIMNCLSPHRWERARKYIFPCP